MIHGRKLKIIGREDGLMYLFIIHSGQVNILHRVQAPHLLVQTLVTILPLSFGGDNSSFMLTGLILCFLFLLMTFQKLFPVPDLI